MAEGGAGELPFDAVVLAGGASRRLGGVDKTLLPVGGTPILHRVLAAVAAARRRIIVGPRREDVPGPVLFAREDPPGGGPAAAVPAGLALVTAPRVVVLAGDLPWLSPGTVGTLLGAVGEGAGAVLLDGDGHEQWLAGAWTTAALRALPWQAGARLGGLLGALRPAPVTAPAGRPAWYDVDTPAAYEHVKGRT